jgi:hypothetical protein
MNNNAPPTKIKIVYIIKRRRIGNNWTERDYYTWNKDRILKSYLDELRLPRLNIINQPIFVMVNMCVLFEVRTESLNILKTSVGVKGLKLNRLLM